MVVASIHSSVEAPCILIAIPDGHSKALPTSGSKAKRLKEVGTTDESVSSSKGSSKVLVKPSTRNSRIMEIFLDLLLEGEAEASS